MEALPAFIDELDKIASTRGLRNIRKALKAGTGDVNAMAKRYVRAGALKTTPAGSQVKHLGTGMEGTTTLTVGSPHNGGGFTARKTYDPNGALYSKEIQRRKKEIGVAAKGNENMAQTYGSGVNRGGVTFTHSEYVPGRTVVEASADRITRILNMSRRPGEGVRSYVRRKIGDVVGGVKGAQRIGKAAQSTAQVGGYTLADTFTNLENVRVGRNGKVKVVDYLPYAKGEKALLHILPGENTADRLKRMAAYDMTPERVRRLSALRTYRKK